MADEEDTKEGTELEQTKRSQQRKFAATPQPKEINEADIVTKYYDETVRQIKKRLAAQHQDNLQEQRALINKLFHQSMGSATGEDLALNLNRLLSSQRTTLGSDEVAAEIRRLKAEISEKTKALLEKERSGKEDQKQIEQLRLSLEQLQEKQSLSHLLSRVGTIAQEKLRDFRQVYWRWHFSLLPRILYRY